VLKHVTVCLAAIPRVQRHANQVGGSSTTEEVDRLERVVLEDTDPVTRFQSE